MARHLSNASALPLAPPGRTTPPFSRARVAGCLVLLACALAPRASAAQSLEQLELRKRSATTRVSFGVLALLENSVGLNQERPEGATLVFVAPQLKIGKLLRLRLNLSFERAWLDRQANPYDFPDISLQVSHLGIYTEPYSKISLSGWARYYIPTSKDSRNASAIGRLQTALALARTIGPCYLSAEFSGYKAFHRYTTWDTGEEAGSAGWYRSGGLDEYVQNNSSFGFGERFTVTYTTPLPGLDVNLVWGLYQNREYDPSAAHADLAGSSYLREPRQTTWLHNYRVVLEGNYGLAALPWIKRSAGLSQSPLARTYVALGYSLFAPQLDQRERNLSPFRAKYSQMYIDLLLLY